MWCIYLSTISIREIAHLQMHIEIKCPLLFNLLNMQRRTPTPSLPFLRPFTHIHSCIIYLWWSLLEVCLACCNKKGYFPHRPQTGIIGKGNMMKEDFEGSVCCWDCRNIFRPKNYVPKGPFRRNAWWTNVHVIFF